MTDLDQNQWNRNSTAPCMPASPSLWIVVVLEPAIRLRHGLKSAFPESRPRHPTDTGVVATP